MKKLLKNLMTAATATLVLAACSSDAVDEVGTDPTDPDPVPESATIRITEGGASDDEFIATAVGDAGGLAQGRVIFTTTDTKQQRLYITQTLPGGTAEPFEIPELSNRSTKADGSIDLDGETTNTLDFTFDLNVPDGVEDGAIVYNFWSTTGRGDFRDPSKRLLLGVGTIEVEVGTGVNPTAELISSSGTLLAAPLDNGTSETFFSLYNNQTYRLSEGEELASLWDFGYYYGSSQLAALASASDYPSLFDDDMDSDTPLVAISALTGVPQEELNNFYFTFSDKTAAEFDAIVSSDELDYIAQSTSERVIELEEGDVIEFVDNYGTKGLIKVVEIVNGFTGSISIDIKVQAYTSFDNSDF